jgi:DNA-directed RNA polymerase subunit RPC12/RpoP
MYMLGMREIPYPAEPVRCPDCGHSMILVCTLPKFVSLPEVRKYRCVECGLNASAAKSGMEANAALAIQPQRAVFKQY